MAVISSLACINIKVHENRENDCTYVKREIRIMVSKSDSLSIEIIVLYTYKIRIDLKIFENELSIANRRDKKFLKDGYNYPVIRHAFKICHPTSNAYLMLNVSIDKK